MSPYANPDRRRRYARYWVKLRRKLWFAANGPCRQCGSGDGLQLDHIDPSQKVAHQIWSWSTERRDAELAKCQPLCKTCHKAKTIAQFRKPLVHGTDNAYRKHRCKCEVCRAGNTERARARRMAA